MAELRRLTDRHRPLSSTLLIGSLVAISAVLIALFGHGWLSAEVSAVFLTVREDVGLLSVHQFSHLGGGGQREQASVSSTPLSEWQNQLCSMEKDANSLFSTPCLWAITLRWCGVYTFGVGLLCVGLYCLVLYDMRAALQIVESLDPHVAPFQRAQESQYQQQEIVGVGGDLGEQRDIGQRLGEISHQSMGSMHGMPAIEVAEVGNVPYTSLPSEDSRKSGGREVMNDAIINNNIMRGVGAPNNNNLNVPRGDYLVPIPTVMQLRSIGTLDIGIVETLCTSGAESLVRCGKRLKLITSILTSVIALWLLLYVEAYFYRNDLSRSLSFGMPQLGGAIPLSVSLSISFYLMLLATCTTFMLLCIHPKLPSSEFSSLSFRSTRPQTPAARDAYVNISVNQPQYQGGRYYQHGGRNALRANDGGRAVGRQIDGVRGSGGGGGGYDYNNGGRLGQQDGGFLHQGGGGGYSQVGSYQQNRNYNLGMGRHSGGHVEDYINPMI